MLPGAIGWSNVNTNALSTGTAVAAAPGAIETTLGPRTHAGAEIATPSNTISDITKSSRSRFTYFPSMV
jgi:hypothetical protein